MFDIHDPPAAYRFEGFELDLQSGELRKTGAPTVRLPEQSFQILAMLLERRGKVVSRSEIQLRLWPDGTIVEFEHSIGAAMNRLRQILGDSAESPQFIETLPRRGYRWIGEAERVAQSEPSSRVGSEGPPRRTPEQPTKYRRTIRTRRQAALLIASVGVLLAVGVLGIWRWTATPSKQPRVLRFRQLTTDGHAKAGPLVSDGPRVYFNEILPGSRNIVTQVPINGGESVPFASQLPRPSILDASEDGTELLLANLEAPDSYSIWIQPASAGSPRRVGTFLAHDAAFGPRATSVIYGWDKDVYLIDRSGKSQRKLLTTNNVPFAFRYSPDARTLRFTVFDLQIDDMSIIESATDGAGFRKLFAGCWAKWTPDGRYFVFQDQHEGRLDFWTVPEKKALPWGTHRDTPARLTAGPLDYQYPLPSKDGKTIFALGTARRAELIRYDQRTRKFIPFLAGISAEGLAFSRDGQWVAYTSFPEGDLWRMTIDGSEKRQLTFPPLRAFSPRWSPDGQQIAFTADFPASRVVRNVYLISREAGTPERVLASEQSQSDVDWSPDGKQLVWSSLFVPNAPIYLFDLRTHSITEMAESKGLCKPRWSPDGKMIVAMSTTGPAKLMLLNIEAKRWAEVTSFPVGHYPTWSHDGKYIYFQYSRDEAKQVFRGSIGRLRVVDRRIENLVDLQGLGRVTTGTFVDWFGLAPDDSPLFARDISTQEIYALDIEWP